MFCRTKYTVVGLVVLGFLSTSGISCDPVRQHKVLTFFFDGVPPLGAEIASIEQGTVEAESQSSKAKQMWKQPETVWFVHEPRKNCSLCHNQFEKRRWALPKLSKPIPELCYDCHTDYTASAALVHGPVAVGQCLFCHNPHKSENEHLLKEREPMLCYLCHDVEMVESIPNHSAELSSKCTNCHNAHASPAKSLLKTNRKEKAN